jgi:uncharacterized protein YhdP
LKTTSQSSPFARSAGVLATLRSEAGLSAVALGAMINPVLGLGTFAAQYLLRGPLQQVLAIDVDINGSWADPEVRERSRRATGTPAREPLQ